MDTGSEIHPRWSVGQPSPQYEPRRQIAAAGVRGPAERRGPESNAQRGARGGGPDWSAMPRAGTRSRLRQPQERVSDGIIKCRTRTESRHSSQIYFPIERLGPERHC
jgi:IS5 family transposase